MKPRFRITSKILLLALGNVAALGILFLAFVRWQLGQDFESFLMTTARERIISQTRSIALEMRDYEASSWNQILADHSQAQGVTFALYRSNGEWVAGPKLNLPEQIKERMIAGPPEGRGGREGGRPWEGSPPDMRREVPPARVLANMGVGPYLVSASTEGGNNYWVTMRTFIPPSEQGGRPGRGMLIIASPNLLTNTFFFQLTPWLLIGVVAMGAPSHK